MSYIVYNTALHADRKIYRTERGAKIACTKFNKNALIGDRRVYAVATSDDFFSNIRTVMSVKNLMTGASIEIPSDTPWCCNPASESYWSN